MSFPLAALALLALAPADAPARRPDLAAFFAAEWEWKLREYPESGTSIGLKAGNAEWTDWSAEARARRLKHRVAALEAADAAAKSPMAPADRLDLDIFRSETRAEIEFDRRGLLLWPLNHMEGVQDLSSLLDSIQFDGEQDYRDWTARLTKLPTLVDQTVALMREGVKAHRVPPKLSIERALGVMRRLLTDDPAQSPLFRPFQKFPAALPEAKRKELADAGRDAVARSAVPAYRTLVRFLESEYLPACYDGVGCYHLADGAELYQYLARYHTTTDKTPDEIHNLGLAEVARIRAEMEAIVKQVGYKGTFAEFLAHLRTDPKFGFRTGDELLAEVRRICAQVEKELPRQFGTLPKSRFVVEPVPAFVAPDAPMAYYLNPSADGRRPGTYYINLYKPESRARYQLEALCLHEAVPGHHFQIARAFELEGVPAFRRFSSSGYTAFVEGWALYTESLGDDLGLYRDPYSRFGRLSEEMLRAVRLVVDTGMHAKRWTRGRAVEFAAANCASSLHEIETEIDRYAAWPGQALAYKVGERTIRALRTECEGKLGPKWDVKAFHDVVLDGGSQPLDLLAARVRAWAAGR